MGENEAMSMERFTILPSSQEFVSNWFLRQFILSAPLTKKNNQFCWNGFGQLTVV